VLTKHQIKIRLDSHQMLLRALLEMLINAGVINEEQLRETAISRSLYWRNKALRDLLKMLKSCNAID
jgi:hypothetical protein